MIVAFLARKQFASDASRSVQPIGGFSAASLRGGNPRLFGHCRNDAKIRPPPPFGRHTDRTAAISALLNINKHYHIPTIGGPYSLVVLMFLVTWRGKSHVNSATSMFNHLVTTGQHRETPLRAGAHGRRAKPPGADLFFTMALGAGTCDQRHDMARCRVGDLDLCVTYIIRVTR